jgi:Fe2+ transport system protein FeoA
LLNQDPAALEDERETKHTMNGILKWPWSQSLALYGEGDLCRVREIFSNGIRTHLSELGIREGSVLEYVGKDDAGVWIRISGAKSVRVDRNYTWFIVVEPTGAGVDGELNLPVQ